jgi:hypothetical protein
MLKKALFLAAGAAVLMASPADARYRHHHYYRHYHYYSYYSPYYSSYYSYPAYSYSYPVYYGYPAYYDYPSYYSYPAYSYPTFGISIGFGGYHHYRHWY